MPRLPIDDLNNGQWDDSHHLMELKQIPPALTQLRTLLQQPENADIVAYAIKGESFEDCIGRVAIFLSIALDGDYDVGPLCEVLINAINNRHATGNQPHLSDSRLVNAEIVETEGEVTLQPAPDPLTNVASPPSKLEIQ